MTSARNFSYVLESQHENKGVRILNTHGDFPIGFGIQLKMATDGHKYQNFEDSMVWYDDCPTNLWLDLTNQNMGAEAISSVLIDLSHDSILKLISFTGNISAQDAYSASTMKELILSLQKCLYKNRTLKMIHAADNFLFLSTPSSQNEHTINYLAKLADILADSTITKLDLSKNCVIGQSGLQHSGLGLLVRKYLARQGRGFICR